MVVAIDVGDDEEKGGLYETCGTYNTKNMGVDNKADRKENRGGDSGAIFSKE